MTLSISEIYERDPETWNTLDLETVVKMLRQEGAAFAEKEAQAMATGKKISTKKPSFTKGKMLSGEDKAALADIEIEL